MSRLPSGYNLRPIADLLQTADCRILWLGDCISSRNAGPRLLGGVWRTWPVRWSGRVCTAHPSNPIDGVGLTCGTSGTIAHTIIVPGQSFGDGTVNDYPSAVDQSAFSADTPNATLIFSASWTQYADATYGRCHPLGGVAPLYGAPDLAVRLIYRASANLPAVIRFLVTRQAGVTSFTDFAPNYSGQVFFCDWMAPALTGTLTDVQGQVLTAVGPNETGKYFFHLGSLLYDQAIAAPCVQLDAIAHTAWRTTDHLDPAASADGKYADEHLGQYLYATRTPNLIVVQLGTYPAAGERTGNTSNAAFAANLATVLNRYRAVYANCALPAPRFLLIAPYQTEAAEEFAAGMAQNLYIVAQSQREDVSFLNLYQAMRDRYGSWSDWQAGLLDDGIHPNIAGARTLATLMYEQIIRAAAEPAPTFLYPSLM